MAKKTREERQNAHNAFLRRQAAQAALNESHIAAAKDSHETTLSEEFRRRVGDAVMIYAHVAEQAGTSVARLKKIATGDSIAPRPGELNRINKALLDLSAKNPAPEPALA